MPLRGRGGRLLLLSSTQRLRFRTVVLRYSGNSFNDIPGSMMRGPILVEDKTKPTDQVRKIIFNPCIFYSNFERR
jgi:hypothetical protein